MSRFQKIIIALLGALVLAAAIGAVVIVQQQAQMAAHRALLQCMAIRGYTPDAVPFDEDYMEGMFQAREECA